MTTPVYQQLNEALRDLIRDGTFKEGAKFLTERQIAERFKVSRITANKALASLVSEQRLEFHKGVGTFVRKGTLDYNLRSLTSFTAMAQAVGLKPATQILHFETLNEGIPELNHQPVYYVERLRLADNQPVILERRYFLAELCSGLRSNELAGSIYDLWRDRYFLHIAGAEQTIRAILIDPNDAKLLQTQPNTAGLLNTSIGFLEGPKPFWFEKTLYRGDTYEFCNRLGYIESTVGRLIPPAH
ncbi:MAG: GntR family transcriptional regulator [Acidobacteria bacterium]|nr:GntR family transcriptional regulator [Acidobacteriota bacterium]